MLRRTGPKDVCDYCSKKFWAQSLLGGKYVCNFCYENDPNFLFGKRHFYDALTIQTIWRLSKGKEVKEIELYYSNKTEKRQLKQLLLASLHWRTFARIVELEKGKDE